MSHPGTNRNHGDASAAPRAADPDTSGHDARNALLRTAFPVSSGSDLERAHAHPVCTDVRPIGVQTEKLSASFNRGSQAREEPRMTHEQTNPTPTGDALLEIQAAIDHLAILAFERYGEQVAVAPDDLRDALVDVRPIVLELDALWRHLRQTLGR